MSEMQPPPPTYKPGQVVDGYVWTGTEWLLVQDGSAPAEAPGKPLTTWQLLSGILLLLVAGAGLIQGATWLYSFYDLSGSGNRFAGILLVLGLAGLAVGVGFGVWGVNVLTKKRQ
jgi:hypothetical protein